MNVVELDDSDSLIMTMSSEEEEEETAFHLLRHLAAVIAPAAVDAVDAVEMNAYLLIEFVTMHDASCGDENETKLEMERSARSCRNRS